MTACTGIIAITYLGRLHQWTHHASSSGLVLLAGLLVCAGACLACGDQAGVVCSLAWPPSAQIGVCMSWPAPAAVLARPTNCNSSHPSRYRSGKDNRFIMGACPWQGKPTGPAWVASNSNRTATGVQLIRPPARNRLHAAACWPGLASGRQAASQTNAPCALSPLQYCSRSQPRRPLSDKRAAS